MEINKTACDASGHLLTYFVVPPFGIEFENMDAILADWASKGIAFVDSAVELNGHRRIMWLDGPKGGGIAIFRASKDTERVLLEIQGHMHARTRPGGTSIGNAAGQSLRDRVQLVLPERVPRIAVSLGVKPYREPSVAVTPEHIECPEGRRYVLVVPRNPKRCILSDFSALCEQFGLEVAFSSEPVTNVIPDLDLWFADSKRKMHLLELAANDPLYLQFAKLFYAALYIDVHVSRVDSVHLLASLGTEKANFRRFWTSNR